MSILYIILLVNTFLIDVTMAAVINTVSDDNLVTYNETNAEDFLQRRTILSEYKK